MSQHYSNPARVGDPHALPDIEVFEVHPRDSFEGSYGGGPGWYWWACFPGCLPDGDPNGPFATEAEAIADASLTTLDRVMEDIKQ